jgi:hypothetical protein
MINATEILWEVCYAPESRPFILFFLDKFQSPDYYQTKSEKNNIYIFILFWDIPYNFFW